MRLSITGSAKDHPLSILILLRHAPSLSHRGPLLASIEENDNMLLNINSLNDSTFWYIESL